MDEEESSRKRTVRVDAEFDAPGSDPALSLCQASASIVRVAGAGIVVGSRGRTLGNVCASSPMVEAAEEAQYALGEGPCIDAFSSRAPVLVPDLASTEFIRWSGFRHGALTAGVRAAFGFPLVVGPICIGTLNLYNDRAGDLTISQFADAVTVAKVVVSRVLKWQARADFGAVAWQLERVPAHRAVIHQATGKISVQVRVSVDDALDLLRAHAFAEGRPLSNVAEDVMEGRVDFKS
jgi:hypothetical protein